jgi:Protein of unknown function (DUF1552)
MSMRRRQVLGRFLEVAGASCLGSMVQASLGNGARAVGAKRFIVIAYGNGMLTEHYTPKAVRSESDFDLPAMLEPLAAYRKQILLMGRFFNPHNQDLHGNGWATLSIRPSDNTGDVAAPGGVYGRPSGQSLDRMLAGVVGKDSRISSLNIALNDWKGPPHISSDGPNAAYPPHINPVQAYRATFGMLTGNPDPGGAIVPEKAAIGDQSVLDFARSEARRLELEMGADARSKLQQMQTSLRELEMRLATLKPAPVCTKPAAPNAALDREQSKPGGGEYVMPYGVSIDPKMVEANADVIAESLVCGLTRVASLSLLGGSESHRAWDFLGVGQPDRHEAQHQGLLADVIKGDKYVAGIAARIWKRLVESPEDGGTMADNSMLLLINTGGGSHHNGTQDHGVITLGNAGSSIRTGRYLSFAKGAHCLSDLYVSIANAFGSNITRFGTPEHSKGPLPGLI